LSRNSEGAGGWEAGRRGGGNEGAGCRVQEGKAGRREGVLVEGKGPE